MADTQFNTVALRNGDALLSALPRELLALIIRWLDAASIAFLALCGKAMRDAIRREKTEGWLSAAQQKLAVSDFVRDPKLLAIGLAVLEFPCVSLTAWAVRAGSVPVLDFLRQIGFLDAKIVCRAAATKGDLAVLEWSLSTDIRRHWGPDECRAGALSGSESALTWVKKNGCPCPARDLAMHFGGFCVWLLPENPAIAAAYGTLAVRALRAPHGPHSRYQNPLAARMAPLKSCMRPQGGFYPPCASRCTRPELALPIPPEDEQ